MKYKEFKKLKEGDLVSLTSGKNKGEKARVASIYDESKSYGYKSGMLLILFENSDLYHSTLNTVGSTMISYKAVKREGERE